MSKQNYDDFPAEERSRRKNSMQMIKFFLNTERAENKLQTCREEHSFSRCPVRLNMDSFFKE